MHDILNLIANIQQSNHRAFKQAYQQWHERTYFYFLKKTKSEDESKELVQLTFIKVWQYRTSLSINHSFEVQLFTTARSVWIDDLRKKAHERKKQESMASDFVDAQYLNTSSEFESTNHLLVAIDVLPPMRKKVFELNRLQGYSYKEIAYQLGISVKTVDNHLSQAMKQLKALLMLLVLWFF